MKREQIEERQYFNYEEHKIILSKSNGKCARCGKNLNLSSMTVEHVIPISKGGTNEMDNLIALCHDCNQEKLNYIVSPRAYYNYLPEEELARIQKHYAKYLKEVEWYGKYNYTKEDKKLIPYQTFNHGRVVRRGKDLMTKYFPQFLTLEKTYIDNLEEIIQFVKNYHEKNSLSFDGVDKSIGDIFQSGCIYRLHRKGETIAVLPFNIEVLEDEDDGKYYQFTLRGIMCKYKKPEYAFAIANAIIYVMECMSETNHEGLITCSMFIFENDMINNIVIKELELQKIGDTDKHGFGEYLRGFIIPPADNEKEGRFMYEQTYQLSPESKQKIISNGLERKLHLPSLKKQEEYEQKHEQEVQKFKGSNKINENRAPKKRNKKIRTEIDEYDIRYWN